MPEDGTVVTRSDSQTLRVNPGPGIADPREVVGDHAGSSPPTLGATSAEHDGESVDIRRTGIFTGNEERGVSGNSL